MRTIIKAAAVGAVIAGTFAVATAEPVAADDCNFPTPAVDDFADHVTSATWGITCAEARGIWTDPFWKPKVPYRWVGKQTGLSEGCVSCVAPAEGAAVTSWCKVSGYTEARNPWAPNPVIAGVDWVKAWNYDQWQVDPTQWTTSPYTLLSLFKLDGYPVSEQWYTQVGGSAQAQHTSKRWADFSFTGPTVWFAPAGGTAKMEIMGNYRGDWSATTNGGTDHGLGGCEDDD